MGSQSPTPMCTTHLQLGELRTDSADEQREHVICNERSQRQLAEQRAISEPATRGIRDTAE